MKDSRLKKQGVVFLLACLMLTGCAPQLKVRTIEPAEVQRIASLKRVAVLAFKQERNIGLSGKIETQLSHKQWQGKPYFTVINRRDIQSILKEQRFQYSGILNETHAVEVGELLGAQALIVGEITSATQSDSQVTEMRRKCADKKCKKSTKYSVSCTQRRIHLGGNIRVIDVSQGDIVYSDSLSQAYDWKHCTDDQQVLPSKDQGLDLLAAEMADKFVYKLAPRYKTSYLTLLDSPDIPYADNETLLLENSIEFIEASRLDKAEGLLLQLVQSTGSKSYVALYNLGVVKEAQAEYQQARRYYQMADQLQIQPVEEINLAVVRIEQVIEKHEQALQQIQR